MGAMLNSLEELVTLASDLVWRVLGKESLHIFTDKGASCNNAIESRMD